MAKAKKAPKAEKPIKLVTPKAAKVKKAPRQQTIPGTEQVRNAILDECTASLADIRETMASCRQDEAAEVHRAIQEMQKEAAKLGQASYAYKANGVELLLVPGDVKLRVRALRDSGDAQTDTDEPIIPADGE